MPREREIPTGKPTQRGGSKTDNWLMFGALLFLFLLVFAAAFRDVAPCLEYGPGRVTGVVRAPDGGLTFTHEPTCVRRE